jgi:hypothetical protein
MSISALQVMSSAQGNLADLQRVVTGAPGALAGGWEDLRALASDAVWNLSTSANQYERLRHWPDIAAALPCRRSARTSNESQRSRPWRRDGVFAEPRSTCVPAAGARVLPGGDQS